MKTADCQGVWDVIAEVKKLLKKEHPDVGDRLASVFCDFESAWDEHAEEYHY